MPAAQTTETASAGAHAGAPAPALAWAGTLAAGAALGEVFAGRTGGALDDIGSTLLVLVLGVVGALRTGAVRGSGWFAVGLALLAGARVAASGPTHGEALAARAPAGIATAKRTARLREREMRAWNLGPAGREEPLVTASGGLRPGELVAVLPTAARPGRARGPVATATRPRARLPRADEIVRIAAAPRAAPPDRPPREGWAARLRRRGIERALTHPDAEAGGLLAALLFGAPEHLPSGVTDLFTRTGTRHLLALSGFHVALLGLLFAVPLARLACGAAAAAGALFGRRVVLHPGFPTALLSLAFVPLAGAGAPATRAAIALALAVVGPAVGRRPSGANLLGIAFLLEVAVDPRAPLRAGVQLSYLATLALILAAPRACRAAAAALPGRGRFAPTSATGHARPALLRVSGERLVLGVLVGVTTSYVATLATLPIVWARFGEWSAVGLVATPLAAPLLLWLVGAGWLWILAPRIAGDASVEWASRALLAGLNAADRAPASPLPLPERPALAIAVAATLALLGASHARRGVRRSALRAAALAFAFLLMPWPRGPVSGSVGSSPPRGLEVHVLDVGNGACTVVRAPGSSAWIIDAGSRDRSGVATAAAAPLLRALDVRRTAIILTHDHRDHARDLPWITRRWSPRLWAGPRPTQREAPGLAPSPLRGVPRIELGTGATRLTPPGAPLEVRALRGGAFGHNEGSALVDVRWRSRAGRRQRVVLCGDAESHGLAALLFESADGVQLEPGPVDLLLLPHHGSDAAQIGPLLDHLDPRAAVVSGGPDPPVAAELRRRGIPLHVTGASGPLSWRLTTELAAQGRE